MDDSRKRENVRKADIAKTQHYVPQFMLKNFSFSKKLQVWVFDKKTGKKFKSHIKNVAAEKGFYDFKFKNRELTIEPSLSNFEAKVSKIIDDIVKARIIAILNENDRIILSYFFSLQFTRTKQYRIMFKDLKEGFLEAIKSRGWDPKKVEGYSELTEENLKLHDIVFIAKSDKFAPHFFNKSWLLFETTEQMPLYIGDNPIALQNMQQFGPYGNIGLAVKGIEIYFPLSKTLSLGMYCPSIEEEIRKGYEKYKLLYQIDPGAVSGILKDPQLLEQMMAGFESKMTIQFKPDNVVNHNSLQVEYSSRFVFSHTDDFSLAEQMIQDNPKFREGPKLEIN